MHNNGRLSKILSDFFTKKYRSNPIIPFSSLTVHYLQERKLMMRMRVIMMIMIMMMMTRMIVIQIQSQITRQFATN